MKIIKFIWDYSKNNSKITSDYSNGRSLMIGQHLLNKDENTQNSHINLCGISLDVVRPRNIETLHKLSGFSKYVDSEIVEVSKEEAREALIAEIDKALDIMFNEENMLRVNEDLNQ